MFSSKIFNALIVLCFFMINVNAMQKSGNLKYGTTQSSWKCKVTRYPNWNELPRDGKGNAIQTIDIEIEYEGVRRLIKNIDLHHLFPNYDNAYYLSNVLNVLLGAYPKMTCWISYSIADYIYKDVGFHRATSIF